MWLGGNAEKETKMCLSCLFPMTRPGSVAVESTVIFRKNAVNEEFVKSQLTQRKEDATRYNLVISEVSGEALSPAAAQHQAASLFLYHWVPALCGVVNGRRLS